jgi:hypothetical protein
MRVFRKHWREPRFWKWWWQNRLSLEIQVGAMLVLLALLLGGGWLAADRLAPANAADSSSYVLETTVNRVVTVREQGKVVRKLVPVVRRILVKRATQYRTETHYGTRIVTTPGGVRVVREPVIRYVPKVRTRVVTNKGQVRTVSETRFLPTTNIETRTQTAVVTGERTITNTATAIQIQTVVNARTVTDTQTATVINTVTDVQTQTETQPAITVTLPAETVTVTVTVPIGP